MFYIHRGKKRKSNTSYAVNPQNGPIICSWRGLPTVLPGGTYLKYNENGKGATQSMQITLKPKCKYNQVKFS